MRTLSKRLAEARKDKGWSQEELARRAGCSQSLIGNLEAERQQGSAKLPQIADALGVSALWLAEGKGPKRHETADRPAEIGEMVIDMEFFWRCIEAVDAYLAAGRRSLTRRQQSDLACMLYSFYHLDPDTTQAEMVTWLERWLVFAKRMIPPKQSD